MTDLLNEIHTKVLERKSMGLTCTEIFLSREEKDALKLFLGEYKGFRVITQGDCAQVCPNTLLGMKVRVVDDEVHIR